MNGIKKVFEIQFGYDKGEILYEMITLFITKFVIIKTVIMFAFVTIVLIVGHAYKPLSLFGMIGAVITIGIDVICLISVYIICAISFQKVLKNSKINPTIEEPFSYNLSNTLCLKF